VRLYDRPREKTCATNGNIDLMKRKGGVRSLRSLGVIFSASW
jgi:hypothetical protein